MEKLRKALLLASADREKNNLEFRAESIPHLARAASQSKNSQASDLKKIEYNETKIVALDPSHLEKHRVLSGSETQEVAQAYKMLRTQVLHKLKLNEWNSLALVSPRSGNGKSLTAVNLALSLSQEVKHTVLLVDLDLKKPSLHHYLGINLNLGITDYLLRDEPVSNILINPGVERLVFLGGTESLEHSSEALGAPKLIRLVEEIIQRYPNRIIIFDLPPILLSDDAVVFSPYVDAMLMVVEEGKTTAEELERCAELLNGKPLLGSVLNKGLNHV